MRRDLPHRAPLAFALLLASAAVAEGQQSKSPVPLPPIEVIVNRTAEATHDVPAPVEVISGTELRARGVTSLRDALALATGVAIAPGSDGGPASAVPEFWGLREFDAFLLVVDGIPWGGALNPAVASLSLRDVERIEILRGPAPVTYGATSFVGVIHVVHTPAGAGAKYVEGHGGSFGSGGAAGDFALSSLGAWGSRLTADFERQGFRDDNTSFTRGHALLRTARSKGDHSTWLRIDVNILQQDPASPHPRVGTSLSSLTPLDANYNPSGAYLNENRVNLAGGYERPIFHGASWGSTASYTFSSQSMFRGFLTDVSNTQNNAAGFKENIDINDVYADTHIIWPTIAKARFMAGADVLFAGGEAKGATFTYTAPLGATSRPGVAEPSTLDRDAGNDRRFLGAYGNAEWRPIPRLTLNGGLRVNATAESRGEGEEVAHTRLSGGVGALLGLWERGENHLRGFVNYRNTFKPAAFDFSLAENEGVLDPETSQSYEGGLKIRVLDGRMDLEASAFHMDFENLVTSTVVNNLPALVNAGKTRFQGVELATDLRLPYTTVARATYSFHDGRFVDFVQDFGGTLTQLAGNRFEMSARHLASLGFTFAPERGLIADAAVNYNGDRYLDKRNRALAPAFTTVDAGIGYRTGAAEIRLDGRNLGDRRDAVAESEFGDAQYYRMPARSIRAGVVLRY